MKCDRCEGQNPVLIATGFVNVMRCMTCFYVYITCLKCSGSVGAKAPTFQELHCRNSLCGYTTTITTPKVREDFGKEDGS